MRKGTIFDSGLSDDILKHHTDDTGNVNRMELLENYVYRNTSAANVVVEEIQDITYLDIQSDCASLDNDDRINLMMDNCEIKEEIGHKEVIDLSKDDAVVVPSMNNLTTMIDVDLRHIPESTSIELEEVSLGSIKEIIDLVDYDSSSSVHSKIVQRTDLEQETTPEEKLAPYQSSTSSNHSTSTLESAEPATPRYKTFGPRDTGLTSASQEQLLMQFVTPSKNIWQRWWRGEEATEQTFRPVLQRSGCNKIM
jgi:hypothetical protein